MRCNGERTLSGPDGHSNVLKDPGHRRGLDGPLWRAQTACLRIGVLMGRGATSNDSREIVRGHPA